MPWLIALGIPVVWASIRSFLTSSGGSATAGALGGYLFGQSQQPSIWPSAAQFLGLAAVLMGGAMLLKQFKKAWR